MRRLWLLIPLLLVSGLTYAVYTLRIAEVSVTGVQTLSPREVVAASGLRIGDRILWERLSVAERRIEEIPAVADAVAVRVLPSRVVIKIRERTPLARLDGARELVADASGVVFDAGDVQVAPVLYGWKGRKRAGARLDADARAVLDAFSRFPEPLRARVRKIRSGRTLVVVLIGGVEVRFGALIDLELKARTAQAVLDAEKRKKLEYVDVRSPAVPVSKERLPPTPTPAADAAQATPTPAAEAAPALPQATPTPSPAPSAPVSPVR